jgi:hypothetical protein
VRRSECGQGSPGFAEGCAPKVRIDPPAKPGAFNPLFTRLIPRLRFQSLAYASGYQALVDSERIAYRQIEPEL